jgi:hypothetical protein
MVKWFDAEGDTSTAVDFVIYPSIINFTETSVSISTGTTSTPATGYVVNVQQTDELGTPIGSVRTVEFTSQPPLVINNLIAGSIYTFTIRPKLNTVIGNGHTISGWTLSSTSINNSIISSGSVNPVTLIPGQSYLSISNKKNSRNTLSMAYKDFNGLTIPASTTVTSIPSYINAASAKDYGNTATYYAFGTSIYLKPQDQGTSSSGGLGFFVDEFGKKGYYVLVQSTKLTTTAKDTKSIVILKGDGQQLITLKDSQQNTTSTFEGVFGSQQYNLDVTVKLVNQTITINVYINGHKITATDTNDYTNEKSPNYINPPTKKVAVICGAGEVSYDYAYATNITDVKYDTKEVVPNLYLGKFSNDMLNISLGDIVYDSQNAQDTLKDESIEDFGTVVREIYHADIKIDARPGFPLKWSTGANSIVNIIGQKISNFTAEAYLLNNSSTTIPLVDGTESTVFLYGNSVSPSGDIEYSTDDTADYVYKEPAVFTSKWLQNLTDVKSLANWIKTKVANRGKVITMEVFGNPLLSVGDIITVKYTFQGFAGTEKMIITNIQLSYNDGLETTITARTL